MKARFGRNLSNGGRLIRGVLALAMWVAAWFGFRWSVWVGVGLAGLESLPPRT